MNSIKKYPYTRVSLLIGLLTLHTLSACVERRQALGLGTREFSRPREEVITIENFSREDHCTMPQSITYRDVTYRNLTRFGLIAILFSGITYGFTRYFGTQANTTNLGMHNDSSLAISESFMPSIFESIAILLSGATWNFSNYLENQYNTTNLSIHDNGSLITSDPFMLTQWHRSIMPHTSPDSSNEQMIINAIQGKTVALIPDQEPSEWVTSASLDNLVTLEEPMLLDNRVLDDLIQNDFSKKRIKYWLARGLNIDAQDEHGCTLLMYGIKFCINTNAFQFIIDQGANVNAQDNHGNTALHLLIVRDACLAHTQYLLKVKNIDLNVINHDGRTALHMAILYSDTDMLNVLLASNCIGIDTKDKDGNTPLFLAIKLGRVLLAERLMQVPNIDLNIIDNDKRTALHWAVKRGYLSLIEAILRTKNKVDINARDKDGNTPLYLAIDLSPV